MITKFKIFESADNFIPKFELGNICIYYNDYDIPYKYTNQKCEVIKVPEDESDRYKVLFDNGAWWYANEKKLKLMSDEDKENYEDNLSKIGKIYYYMVDSVSYIPKKFHNTRCELVDISDYDNYVVKFLNDDMGYKWDVNEKDLITEEEMIARKKRHKEIWKKFKYIDPYGEEDWEDI